MEEKDSPLNSWFSGPAEFAVMSIRGLDDSVAYMVCLGIC